MSVGGGQSFSYRRSLAPGLWMLIAIMTVELLVVHPLLAVWWPTLALGLSVVSLAVIGWLVWAVASFGRLPVRLDDSLTLRVGTLKDLTVPLTEIVAVGGEVDRATVEARTTLNLALLSWPNVHVALASPVGTGRRRVDMVTHRLDDAPSFVTALHERLEHGA